MLDLDLKKGVNPFKTWPWPSSQSRAFLPRKANKSKQPSEQEINSWQVGGGRSGFSRQKRSTLRARSRSSFKVWYHSHLGGKKLYRWTVLVKLLSYIFSKKICGGSGIFQNVIFISESTFIYICKIGYADNYCIHAFHCLYFCILLIIIISLNY